MATVSFLAAPPAYIKTLAVTVTGPGIASPMVFNLTIDSVTHVAAGTITVPAGSARHIVANAFDSLGVNTHRGETTVTLAEGNNPAVSFTMVSLTGSVVIQISFGSAVLVLTPGDTTVQVGDTLSFTFAGTDEHGTPITAPVWGVSNPAVASYLGGDKVVALAEGVTTVTVNAGFGAIARTVTVAGGVPPSPTTGVILFQTNRSGNLELYTVNPDGSGETLLPTGLPSSSNGSWGPGRATVAFVSGNNVYVMNTDGSGRTQLTSTGCNNDSPQISPNGAKIVWSWEAGGCSPGSREIYTMNIDGTGVTQLTNNSAADNFPWWSTDGTKIFFSSTRDGGDEEVYVMDADGSNQTRLTNTPGFDGYVHPSPDGTRLEFTSTRDGNNEVYVMNVDGTNPVRYTSDGGADEAGGWSPDGAWLAFSSDRTGNYQVYIVPVGGGNAPAVTTNPAFDFARDWK